MRVLFVVYLFLSIGGYGQGGNEPLLAARLDSLFSTAYSAEVPGAAVLVAQKGEIRYEKAFGSACLELRTAMSPSMLFDLGSITKQFTAVAILQLVEQGKIALNDSIQRFIPDFPFKGHTITVENLLTHTSGIVDYMQLDEDDPYLIRKDFTTRAIIDTLRMKPLVFEPGTRFQYSNSGYYLLGYIIELASGEPYHRYLEKHLFAPLGLHHTYFNLPGEVIPGHVYGYKKEAERFEKADFWSTTLPYAAGGLVSNVEDLYQWHLGLQSGKLIKAGTLQKAHASFVLRNGDSTGYGYGWYISGEGSSQRIGHGGAISGFRTNEVYYPDQDIYIAILCNRDNAPVDDLTLEVSNIVLGKAPDIALPDSVLNNYAGTYFMAGTPKRVMVIQKEDGHLTADVKGQGVFRLLFSTQTAFEFKGVPDATAEFRQEGGKITGFIVHQHGVYEWRKK
jgi:CubicO group peptidase (beta-lactamase class C family)